MAEAWCKADAENIGMEPIASEEQGIAILNRIKEAPFTITSVTKKDGKELPPSLFDLSSLQTECDKRFSIPLDRFIAGVFFASARPTFFNISSMPSLPFPSSI